MYHDLLKLYFHFLNYKFKIDLNFFGSTFGILILNSFLCVQIPDPGTNHELDNIVSQIVRIK